MKIAVLTHNPNALSNKRFTEAAHKYGHDISFIPISDCYMNISSIKPTVYYRNHESFQNLDAIIPRINQTHSFYGTAVLRQFELMGIYTLNSSLSITWTRDKLRALQLLARKNLPLPITGFADSPEETEKLIDIVGGAPLIIRLLEGTEGRGTIFAETHQAAVSVINAFKQLKTNILVQECIQEAMGNDIRCVVVGNKVIAAIQRTIHETGPHSARHTTKSTTPVEITTAEKKMAVQAAKAMKLNLACVDLIRSKRGPLVLDIDCSPSIEMLEKITKVDIIDPIIQFLMEHAKL
jgi:ribosomal protein S6--L-glutamate ligase